MKRNRLSHWIALSSLPLLLATSCQVPPAGPMKPEQTQPTFIAPGQAGAESPPNAAKTTEIGSPILPRRVADSPARQRLIDQLTALMEPQRHRALDKKFRLLEIREPGYATSAFVGATLGMADGVGEAAKLGYPMGLAVASDGILYATDVAYNRILKISPAGLVQTIAGTGEAGGADGPGGQATFDGPTAVAIDNVGNLIVTDFSGCRIRRVTPSGLVTTIAGTGAPGFADGAGATAQFNGPRGVTVDSIGNIYITDNRNQRIRKISPELMVSTFSGNPVIDTFDGTWKGESVDGVASAAKLDFPNYLKFDANHNLYFTQGGGSLRIISPDGNVRTLAGGGNLVTPDFPDGDGSGAKFNGPVGFDFDGQGNLILAGGNGCSVRKIKPTGQVTTIAGTWQNAGYAEGDGATALFFYPFDISMSPSGVAYVSDPINFRIRKLGSQQPEVAISVGHPAFSPNGDLSKDTIPVEISAKYDWTISVDGHPGEVNAGPSPNTGNKSFAWDGRVNGIILPDGKYTLRLKTGAEEKTVDVIIDTIAPNVMSAPPTKIKSTIVGRNPTKISTNYVFSIKAEDPGNGSGINEQETKFSSSNMDPNPQITKISESEHEATVRISSNDSETLTYRLAIEDNAGNRVESKENSITGRVRVSKPVFDQYSTPPLSYNILGTGKTIQGTRDFQGVYYSRSGLRLKHTQKFTFKYFLNKKPLTISGETYMLYRNQSEFGQSWIFADQLIKFTTWQETEAYTFDWSGGIETGERAGTGSYILEPFRAGWVEEKNSFQFKVSDMYCIKPETWRAKRDANDLRVDNLPIDRVAHIFSGHILNPLTPGRPDLDLFGKIDVSLSFPRPPKYTEQREASVGYKDTGRLLTGLEKNNRNSRAIFKTVVAMGDAVYADENNDSRKQIIPGATAMPVVFDNDLVKWVAIVKPRNGNGIVTVYPAHQAGSEHESTIQ